MAMNSIPPILAVVFVVGACLGALANWAIYRWAWNSRPISPWLNLAPGASPRGRLSRVPVLGWFALRQEAELHGKGFWLRPLLIEIGMGAGLAALYWWEVARIGLIQGQTGVELATPFWPVHLQFASHAILICWMLAASFIDIDEKIIPDEITVSGTIVGLALAAIAPISLLPHVAQRPSPAIVSVPLQKANGGPAVGDLGDQLWLESTTVVAPRPWQAGGKFVTGLPALAIGLGCYWLWCFALAPRIWRGRRGAAYALRLIASRVARELNRLPLRPILGFGSMAIILVWWFGEQAWVGLLSALVGLVASGGIVWAVRLIGTAALKREAMGFGDVTLMMMIGTFLGWQACLILFFLAPFAALLVGVFQFLAKRDDVIPYGPFLCMAAVAVIVAWAPIWMWAQPMFEMGGLVPAVLIVCLAMLGIMLAFWRMVKIFVFGLEAEDY
jgi:prepilin signal peptidase PulO-like enzyme (type II secretory pathway)